MQKSREVQGTTASTFYSVNIPFHCASHFTMGSTPAATALSRSPMRFFCCYHSLQNLSHTVLLVVRSLAISGRSHGRILDMRHAPTAAGLL